MLSMQPTIVLPPQGGGRETSLSAPLFQAVEALDMERPFLKEVLGPAIKSLNEHQPEMARKVAAEFLASNPENPDALYVHGRALTDLHRSQEAADHFRRALELSPDFRAARFHYAKALLAQTRSEAALEQLETLLADSPESFLFRDLKITALMTLGRSSEAAEACHQLTDEYPDMAWFWIRYGENLRTVGRREDCISAFRKAIEISPSFGGSYWSLGDLKTFRFTDAEIAAMQAQLRQPHLSSENRTYFHFALAKAFADHEQYGRAFEQYARANALRRIHVEYDPEMASEHVSVSKALLTQDFFAARANWGSHANGPIFVLGMHRSGTTLVEQILSSHSAIEGIGEAREIVMLARRLELEVAPRLGAGYPGVLSLLDADTLREIGEEYLSNVAPRRKLGRPFFVDKNPANLWCAGIIHLILPNAKIIDVRRHPMACCFSNFSTIFGTGSHTYRQSDLGRYYVDYVRLMAHFDRVLPGRVHRVIYERLVSDTEGEVRRLLDYLGLPFEERCLEFYKTQRAVATPSSEQVRRPINDEGLNRWRNYEPWLGPLKAALGPILEHYPEVPSF